MEPQNHTIVAHPQGEQPTVEARSAIADTFAGRIHVEWDATAPVTPFGQLPFFIDFLKQGDLFDRWVADCPQFLTSNNAPYSLRVSSPGQPGGPQTVRRRCGVDTSLRQFSNTMT